MQEQLIANIRSIQTQMNELETRCYNQSLTLAELVELDSEWDMLDAQLKEYDNLLEAAYALTNMWNITQWEEPVEPPDEYYQERELEGVSPIEQVDEA